MFCVLHRRSHTQVGKPWYRADWDRGKAEAHLRTALAGSFCVRPSSKVNSLALSHGKGGGVVGHAIINLHRGDDGHFGYSIEDRGVYYATLEELLHNLSDLRFDLVAGGDAAGGGPAPSAASLRPSLAASVEFQAFLPRTVAKDSSGNFEAPKYTTLGTLSQSPLSLSDPPPVSASGRATSTHEQTRRLAPRPNRT